MKIDARGSKKEPHRSNFAPQGVLWSPPGASWAPSRPQKGALGGKEEFENCVEGSWDHLGVLLARLGPILGRISPPLGGPGEAPGGHFWTFLGRPSRDLKNELLFVGFSHIWGLFSVLLFALCCLPCSVAGGVVHMQKTEISLVFVGRKPHAPCSGNARSNQLSGGTRNKYRWKKELKKRTHGTRKQGRQKSIFEAKMAPKMDPGGFQKRVHKTVGN